MKPRKPVLPKQAQDILLEEILGSAAARYQHRLHAVLVVVRGASSRDAARMLGCSHRAAQQWVKAFSESGVSGLMERAKSGRPPALPPSAMARLETELSGAAQRSKPQHSRWSGPLLRDYLAKHHGVHLGLRQCQRMLRGLSRRAS